MLAPREVCVMSHGKPACDQELCTCPARVPAWPRGAATPDCCTGLVRAQRPLWKSSRAARESQLPQAGGDMSSSWRGAAEVGGSPGGTLCRRHVAADEEQLSQPLTRLLSAFLSAPALFSPSPNLCSGNCLLQGSQGPPGLPGPPGPIGAPVSRGCCWKGLCCCPRGLGPRPCDRSLPHICA